MATIPLYISLGGVAPDCITIANDAAFTQGMSNINKKEILSVQQVFQDLTTAPEMINLQRKYHYPYIMRIMILRTNNESYSFECQSVANQPTWNVVTNPTIAEQSLAQANIDISNFI